MASVLHLTHVFNVYYIIIKDAVWLVHGSVLSACLAHKTLDFILAPKEDKGWGWGSIKNITKERHEELHRARHGGRVPI